MSSPLSPIQVARSVKHAAWLHLRSAKRKSEDGFSHVYSRLFPYHFEAEKYPLCFVSLPTPTSNTELSVKVPRRIFTVWSGDNPMSRERREGLDSIRRSNPGTEVILVTPENLSDYVVKDHPLHPSYRHLSLNHRSDYLRAYLLTHHGGGYSDVKPHPASWESAFTHMDDDKNIWIIGYQIPSLKEASWIDSRLGRDVHRHFPRLIGSGGYIARAQSPLMREWLDETHRRLNYYSALLEAQPGSVWGDNAGYPIPWTALGSQILEPLCLKYLDHVRIDPNVKPQLWGHR